MCTLTMCTPQHLQRHAWRRCFWMLDTVVDGCSYGLAIRRDDVSVVRQ